MAVEVPQMKRFLDYKRMGEKSNRFCYPSKKSEYGEHIQLGKRGRITCLVRC